MIKKNKSNMEIACELKKLLSINSNSAYAMGVMTNAGEKHWEVLLEILKEEKELSSDRVALLALALGENSTHKRKEISMSQPKLVRDKIPQIIRSSGKTPITRILSEQEYLVELDKKLNEEIAEYQADKSIEEMADVLEVLYAICEARGHSIEELHQVCDKKREERGGFEERIFWSGNE